MTTLNIILTIILVLCSIILIAVVLMQQTKSSGLGGAFGGDTQSFTARGQAASKENKLQKITVYSAVAIGVLAITIMILA
ncbi:MAG: preprotein translocase subunit SecG [Candidatus Pelethousia sp.]|nr:preprotein translocase subunit SecG [Candidatus Pelethousia sp.]